MNYAKFCFIKNVEHSENHGCWLLLIFFVVVVDINTPTNVSCPTKVRTCTKQTEFLAAYIKIYIFRNDLHNSLVNKGSMKVDGEENR